VNHHQVVANNLPVAALMHVAFLVDTPPPQLLLQALQLDNCQRTGCVHVLASA
jgi:hypothetical protein